MVTLLKVGKEQTRTVEVKSSIHPQRVFSLVSQTTTTVKVNDNHLQP